MAETGQFRQEIMAFQAAFGLSNAALGRLLGVHSTMISRWRTTGRVPGPAIAYMRLYREREDLKRRIREMVS